MVTVILVTVILVLEAFICDHSSQQRNAVAIVMGVIVMRIVMFGIRMVSMTTTVSMPMSVSVRFFASNTVAPEPLNVQKRKKKKKKKKRKK